MVLFDWSLPHEQKYRKYWRATSMRFYCINDIHTIDIEYNLNKRENRKKTSNTVQMTREMVEYFTICHIQSKHTMTYWHKHKLTYLIFDSVKYELRGKKAAKLQKIRLAQIM